MLAFVVPFISGAAALVYQTPWVRRLGLVVGVDVYSVTTAVAAGAFHRLYIQGLSNSGDSLTSLRYMRLLPLLIHRGESRSALVIGLGTEITAGALPPSRALASPKTNTTVPSSTAGPTSPRSTSSAKSGAMTATTAFGAC